MGSDAGIARMSLVIDRAYSGSSAADVCECEVWRGRGDHRGEHNQADLPSLASQRHQPQERGRLQEGLQPDTAGVLPFLLAVMPFLEAILTFLAAQKWEDELVAWLEEYDAENKD
eukprot:2859919-Rhodomonas_salina.2